MVDASVTITAAPAGVRRAFLYVVEELDRAGRRRMDARATSPPPMEFFVYSRGAIERVPPHDVPHVIISITTTTDDRAQLPASIECRGILRLVFPDLDVQTANAQSALFDAAQANEIWDFVDTHASAVSRILLHCDAGVSRSPAVAAALSKCLDGDDSEFFRRYRPNMRVYRLLVDTWHERVERRGAEGVLR